MMTNKQYPPIIIFGGDNYNSLGMIRTLGEHGIDFEAILIRNQFIIASKSRYIKKSSLAIVESIDQGYSILKTKIDKNTKKFILVEGDGLTGFLDRHYNEIQDYFIWNNAGEQGRLSQYLDKKAQVDLVKEFGINVLPSITVKTGEIPENLEYPVMTKAVTSEMAGWKSEVHVCNNREELCEAYKKIKSKDIMLQKYIKKKNELCLDGYSINRGNDQFISIATSYTYLLDNSYSFYATIKNPDNSVLAEQIRNVMKKVGYEGIYSIEFIIDENNIPYFLEINFRNSGWSWASTCVGMPLPILWIDSMLNNTIDESKYTLIPDNYSFVDDFADFKTRAGKMISYGEWLREYRQCNCKLILGRNDIRPFWSYIFYRALFMIRRRLKIQQ